MIDPVFPKLSHKQREQVLDGADSTRTDIANCSIHFLMGDASNSGWLQISKHQTMKIMSRYCWADVQSKEGAFTHCATRISPRTALVVDVFRWV